MTGSTAGSISISSASRSWRSSRPPSFTRPGPSPRRRPSPRRPPGASQRSPHPSDRAPELSYEPQAKQRSCCMSPKRTGRYGDRPTAEPGKSSNPPFGDRRGAPLPLLTQPMVAVEINRRELNDPAQTRLDNAPLPRVTDSQETRLDGPRISDPVSRLDGMAPLKVEANAIVHAKPTVMMAP